MHGPLGFARLAAWRGRPATGVVLPPTGAEPVHRRLAFFAQAGSDSSSPVLMPVPVPAPLLPLPLLVDQRRGLTEPS